ncbi:MAG: hypothetical protein LHW57_05105 [Candidatus Cloacimonetes bacterium]|nr:hypothetical protein [Candidatus Cloacimonadota bacterium]
MKFRTAFITVALVAMLALAACGVKDKAMEVANVTVNGNAADFVKVTDGTYTLKNVEGGLELTLGTELLQECVAYNPDSLEVGNWYLSFMNAEGTMVTGMESMPLREEHKAEIIALMKGTVGDKKDLTYFRMIDNKDDIKRILGEVAMVQLNTEIIFPETEMAPEEEMPEETETVASNVQPKPKPKPTPPTPVPPVPPVQTQNWDKKLDDLSSAMDRYVVMRDKNPTKPMDIKRLQDQRAKVQTMINELTAAPDMTGAQQTRFNQIKAKMD